MQLFTADAKVFSKEILIFFDPETNIDLADEIEVVFIRRYRL